MDKFILTDDMHKYISLQRTGIKSGFDVKYYNNIKTQWDNISPHVKNIKSVLDIGCGIGGIDYFISTISGDIIINLLDKTQIDDNIYYGFEEKASFYNNLELSEKFLRLNGVTNELRLFTPESDLMNIDKVDLVISLISWGFHYPISTYIDIVDNILSENGIIIIDIRHTRIKESIGIFEKYGFSHETICNFEKCDRIKLFRNGSI